MAKSLLRYTRDMSGATAEITSFPVNGAVTQILSDVLFVASVPATFDERLLQSSEAAAAVNESNLDEVSKLMMDAWAVVESKALARTTSTRHISAANLKGTIAVGLVVETAIREKALPFVLGGAQSLALKHATATFIMDPRFVTSTYIPGLTISIPPQGGMTASQVPPSTRITAWPGAVSFNDQLFCFYQGFDTLAQRLFYNVYDGNSWAGQKQVPNTIMSEGPFPVVFNNKLYCFKQGNRVQGELWYNVFDGANWSGDAQVPYLRMVGGPTAVVFNGNIYCFYQGYGDNKIWYNVFDGQTWTGNKALSATSLITGSPSAVLFNNLIHVYYQGFGTNAHVLMECVLNPAVGEQVRGPSPVPNAQRMSEGPAAVVVAENVYLFHQDESGGKLYVNVSSDGETWPGEDTLLEDVNLTSGPAAASFKDELYFFFQRGQSGNVTDGSLWYRKLVLATQGGSGNGGVAAGEPSLESLGDYAEGYEGYRDFADQLRQLHRADFGYVVYITTLTPLFNVYADEFRMCMQYSEPSYINEHFYTMFAAEGVYDQRLVSDSHDYPARPVSRSSPRYTLAWVEDWKQSILNNATVLSFHRGDAVNDRKMQLWVVFLDKRNARWVEVQGPRILNSNANGAPAPLFGPGSRLYVFYNNSLEMRYNELGERNESEQTIWGVERVAFMAPSLINSPSPISVGSNIRVYHESSPANLSFATLNGRNNVWTDSTFAFSIGSHGSPSAVHYLNKIYVFHQGSTDGNFPNKLSYSIWDIEEDTWQYDNGTMGAQSTLPMQGEPAAVVYKNVVYCFYTSLNDIWYNIFDGSAWAGARRVPMQFDTSKPMDGAVSAAVWNDNIHCFFRIISSNSLLYHKVFNVAENTWDDETILPTASGLFTKPGAILNHFLFGS